MKRNPKKERVRNARNETSRNEADQHGSRWSENELDTLLELWSENTEDLIALAALLGRTVEACRQKYYLTRQRRTTISEKVTESVKILDTWSKGFTSLADMGY